VDDSRLQDVWNILPDGLACDAEQGREELREDTLPLASWRWRRTAQDSDPIILGGSASFCEHLLLLLLLRSSANGISEMRL
jgi:hypothetical protein